MVTPSPREPLVLRNDAVLAKVAHLFTSMQERKDLQHSFITDPAGTMAAHGLGLKLPEQQVSVSNQLLFSILANEKLMSWLRGYAAGHGGKPPHRQKFMQDFGRAIVEHGGEHAVLALLRASIEKQTPAGLGPEVAFLISDSPIIASGHVAKTNQQQEQKQTLPQDQRSSQNFQQSTRQDSPATQANASTQNSNAGMDSAGLSQQENQKSNASAEQDQGQGQEQDQGQAQGQEQDSSGRFQRPDYSIYSSMFMRATVAALVAHAALLEAKGELSQL